MILIGTDNGIYRWFEGAGWPIFHSLQDRAIMGLASPGTGVLAAIDRAGDVLESTDNGMSWRTIPVPAGAGRPSAVAFDGSPPALILAVKPLNLYSRAVGAPVPKSGAVPSSLAPRLVHQARGLAERGTALMAPNRPRAKPPGAEAVRLAGWLPATAPHAPRAAISPEVRALTTGPHGWFAAVSGAGLWKSADRGRSWMQCPSLLSEVYAVRAVPGRAGHLWAATGDGCQFSPDGGLTWEDRSAGLETVRHVRAIEVKPGAPDTLLAGVAPAAPFAPGAPAPRQGLNFGLYESTNSGKSWTQITKKNFPESLEYDTITDIQFDPTAPANAVVALGSGELWSTRNGGAYWEPLARQIKAARVLCAVV